MKATAVTRDYPISGMTVVPYGFSDDPLVGGMWFACVQWALAEESLRKRFTADTGLSMESLVRNSPIESMIDESTGYGRHVVCAWCDWVTVNIWGVERHGIVGQTKPLT